MDKLEKDLESILDDNSPKMEEGKYLVGSMTEFAPEYVKGENKWTQSVGLVGADGKKQFIVINNGKWNLSK